MRTIYAVPSKDLRSSRTQKVRNPRYFTEPRADAGEVVVVGEHPRIVKAYEAAGAKVRQVKTVDEVKKAPAG